MNKTLLGKNNVLFLQNDSAKNYYYDTMSVNPVNPVIKSTVISHPIFFTF